MARAADHVAFRDFLPKLLLASVAQECPNASTFPSITMVEFKTGVVGVISTVSATNRDLVIPHGRSVLADLASLIRPRAVAALTAVRAS